MSNNNDEYDPNYLLLDESNSIMVYNESGLDDYLQQIIDVAEYRDYYVFDSLQSLKSSYGAIISYELEMVISVRETQDYFDCEKDADFVLPEDMGKVIEYIMNGKSEFTNS